MPLETQEQFEDTTSIKPKRPTDKNGYYRLGRTTLYFYFFKYGFPVIILFFIELMILGALMGGSNLPPFSEMLSANSAAMTIVREAAGIVPLLMIIGAVFAAIMGYISYWLFRYKIEYNYLSFVKGIINLHKISVPFRQIQNVDIDQNLIYRFFGLVSLVILTVGNEDPERSTKNEVNEIVMPPLNVAEGLNLQRHLLDRSNVQRIVTQDPAGQSVVSPSLD